MSHPRLLQTFTHGALYLYLLELNSRSFWGISAEPHEGSRLTIASEEDCSYVCAIKNGVPVRLQTIFDDPWLKSSLSALSAPSSLQYFLLARKYFPHTNSAARMVFSRVSNPITRLSLMPGYGYADAIPGHVEEFKRLFPLCSEFCNELQPISRDAEPQFQEGSEAPSHGQDSKLSKKKLRAKKPKKAEAGASHLSASKGPKLYGFNPIYLDVLLNAAAQTGELYGHRRIIFVYRGRSYRAAYDGKTLLISEVAIKATSRERIWRIGRAEIPEPLLRAIDPPRKTGAAANPSGKRKPTTISGNSRKSKEGERRKLTSEERSESNSDIDRLLRNRNRVRLGHGADRDWAGLTGHSTDWG